MQPGSSSGAATLFTLRLDKHRKNAFVLLEKGVGDMCLRRHPGLLCHEMREEHLRYIFQELLN
ncbi:hypothetical protein N7535_004948 [Penicillium sp. DV-2018c]|nr:hypothetical protein N7461_008529 [Penicillium sp. DV-2018c]KAJ5571288.1 hypothetical protein N7535_004948 [Penicillium sp. DV-2018c]